MGGCPTKPAPGVRFPITTGFHSVLPTTEERILIWGDTPLANLAMEWLRSHHYSHLMTSAKSPLQADHIVHNFSTRQAALVVAREMKADMVLVIERDATKEGALIESECGPLFHVTVDVRGLSVDTGTVALRGMAHYPHCVPMDEKTTRSLTCQALATAWGFRPSGQLNIPSSLMCTTGQTDPLPIR